MAPHGNPFIEIDQWFIQHEEASRGYVIRKALRFICPVNVDVALEGINLGAEVQAWLESPQAEDAGCDEAGLVGAGIRAVLPALTGWLPPDKDHSGRLAVAVFRGDTMQSPWGAQRVLIAGKRLLAVGKRDAPNQLFPPPMLENFLAKNSDEDIVRSF